MSEKIVGMHSRRRYELLADRAVLNELRDHLLARLPGLVRRIVVFGSRARGDFDENSDVDVLVVMDNRRPEVLEQARAARYEVMEQRGFKPMISLILLTEQEWQELSEHSAGLKHNIEHEGLYVWPPT